MHVKFRVRRGYEVGDGGTGRKSKIDVSTHMKISNKTDHHCQIIIWMEAEVRSVPPVSQCVVSEIFSSEIRSARGDTVLALLIF